MAASVANALTAEELTKALADAGSSRVRFSETRHSALLKQPLVLTGTLVFKRPDRLEKHVSTPFSEVVTIEGARVDVTRPGEPGRTIVVPPGPARALVESMRATLAGDLAALTRHFTVDVAGTADDWTMTLTPRDPALASTVVRVDFAGRGGKVRRIEVIEAGGDRSVTTIQDEAR
jgi:hypothetical protein